MKIKDLWLKPRRVAEKLEQTHPLLGRLFLNYASEVSDWSVLGMGLEIEEWSDERVSVKLPARKKNRSAGGELSLGAIAQLSEYCTRLLFDRHLSSGFAGLSLVGCDVRLNQPLTESVSAKLELKEVDREHHFGEMIRHASVELELPVALHSALGLRLGEVTMRLRLTSARALPPPR